jgi:hypothetical protein
MKAAMAAPLLKIYPPVSCQHCITHQLVTESGWRGRGCWWFIECVVHNQPPAVVAPREWRHLDDLQVTRDVTLPLGIRVSLTYRNHQDGVALRYEEGQAWRRLMSVLAQEGDRNAAADHASPSRVVGDAYCIQLRRFPDCLCKHKLQLIC